MPCQTQADFEDVLRVARQQEVGQLVRSVEVARRAVVAVYRVCVHPDRTCYLVMEDGAVIHQGADEVEALRVADAAELRLLTPPPPRVRLEVRDRRDATIKLDGQEVSHGAVSRLMGEALALARAHRLHEFRVEWDG